MYKCLCTCVHLCVKDQWEGEGTADLTGRNATRLTVTHIHFWCLWKLFRLVRQIQFPSRQNKWRGGGGGEKGGALVFLLFVCLFVFLFVFCQCRFWFCLVISLFWGFLWFAVSKMLALCNTYCMHSWQSRTEQQTLRDGRICLFRKVSRKAEPCVQKVTPVQAVGAARSSTVNTNTTNSSSGFSSMLTLDPSAQVFR